MTKNPIRGGLGMPSIKHRVSFWLGIMLRTSCKAQVKVEPTQILGNCKSILEIFQSTSIIQMIGAHIPEICLQAVIISARIRLGRYLYCVPKRHKYEVRGRKKEPQFQNTYQTTEQKNHLLF